MLVQDGQVKVPEKPSVMLTCAPDAGPGWASEGARVVELPPVDLRLLGIVAVVTHEHHMIIVLP